jgi:outer membrane protein TolC
MIAVLLALQLAGSTADSVPVMTLSEALARSTQLDPNYVAALTQVATADWARRSALATFVLPSLTVSTAYTGYSTPQFNIGTSQLAKTIVTAQVDARYELFTGGRHLAEIRRTKADLESAQATEVQARYAAALATESAFYAALSGRELRDVARDRLRRAEEQLVVARARVVSGAVVQTDSLQILLEVNRARVAVLREEAEFTVARLELGRRVGVPGPVEAAGADTAIGPGLPLSLPEAINLALDQGPEYRIARANERSAAATYRSRQSAYWPQATVFGNYTAFGDQWFPNGVSRGYLTLQVSLPLWDNLQRELSLARAKAARDVTRIIRDDLERAARVDVTQAYQAYETARATAGYSAQAVEVARENYRVQQARYRAGASTILDLLEGQTQLTEAQADLVQARYATRLALAGLEALLGRRLFESKD